MQRDGKWTYFCGTLPVFQHAQDDLPSFRMETAQLCDQGVCKQAEIISAFGVGCAKVGIFVKIALSGFCEICFTA